MPLNLQQFEPYRIMIYNEIKNAFERKQYISIICQSVEGMEEEIHGVPVDLSTDFVVLQEISDFFMYGYIILPIDGILEVSRDAADAFIEHILIKEGLMAQVGRKHDISLGNWQEIFEGLKQTGLSVSIHIDVDGDEDDFGDFLIGPVTVVEEESVSIHPFDPEGVYSEVHEEIYYDVISRVAFDEPYANMYTKYLRSLN
jgi:hypothetical protein